jgi:hypothetical protein
VGSICCERFWYWLLQKEALKCSWENSDLCLAFYALIHKWWVAPWPL